MTINTESNKKIVEEKENWLTEKCKEIKDLQTEFNDRLLHKEIKEISGISGNRNCVTKNKCTTRILGKQNRNHSHTRKRRNHKTHGRRYVELLKKYSRRYINCLSMYPAAQTKIGLLDTKDLRYRMKNPI